jgi:hypothetical protein
MDARQLIRWHAAVHTLNGGLMLVSDTGGGGPGVVGSSSTAPSFSSSASAAATSLCTRLRVERRELLVRCVWLASVWRVGCDAKSALGDAKSLLGDVRSMHGLRAMPSARQSQFQWRIFRGLRVCGALLSGLFGSTPRVLGVRVAHMQTPREGEAAVPRVRQGATRKVI